MKSSKIQALQEKILKLEEEMEEELGRLKEQFSYTIEERKIRFRQSVAEYHRRLRKNVVRYVIEARPAVVLVSPVIMALIVPLVFIDIAATIYQAVCFPVYGLKKVPRSSFIVMDRQHLEYLNALERLYCFYCSYANGLIGWIRLIAARTESYWCPIKHARRIKDAHPEYAGFEEYGDADGYRERFAKLKRGERPEG